MNTSSTADRKKALQERIARVRQSRRPIQARPAGAVVPLSDAQRRLWLTDAMGQGGAAYSVAFALAVHGAVVIEELSAAIRDVLTRHDVLRSRYPAGEDGEPTVVVDEVPDDALLVVDAAALDTSPGRDPLDVVADAFSDDLARPFAMDLGLYRFTLYQVDEQRSVLTVVLHHIVADGWTVGMLKSELLTRWSMHHSGVADQVTATELAYADFAYWESLESTAVQRRASEDYWVERLDGVPPLDLALGRTRPDVLEVGGATLAHAMDADLAVRLAALAKESGATLFMALLALYQMVLARYTGQLDFAVGSSVAGRTRPELETIAGTFANMIALRADLRRDPTFADYLARTRTLVLVGLDSQDVGFDAIVRRLVTRRDPSTTPIFQTSMTFDTLDSIEAADGAGIAPAGYRVEPFGGESRVTHWDLGVHFALSDQELIGTFTYRTGLLTEDEVAALARLFDQALREVVDHPSIRLSRLLSDTEVDGARQLKWLGADGLSDARGTLVAALHASAGTPDRVAIARAGVTLTHGELAELSDQVARLLLDEGMSPEDLVAISVDDPMVAAPLILGVLKAGGCYLPIDPATPPERVGYILTDSGARLVLADKGVIATLPEVEADRRVGADLLQEATKQPTGPVDVRVEPRQVAYTIYTSGTTGQPKGVAVQHAEICGYLDDIAKEMGVAAGDSYGLLQSLAFDFSLLLFYLPLLHDGTLHFLDAKIDGRELATRMSDAAIDFIKFTPSHLKALTSETDASLLLPAKALVLAGEGAPEPWATELARAAGCLVINSYGPTETVAACTTHLLGNADPRSTFALLGRPMPGVRTYIVDDNLALVPPGRVGELLVAGRTLARGYVGKPGLTATRFVADPHGSGTRAYRTGDRVSHNEQGSLTFHGRLDDQVKVRGYRIEIGEIESTLATLNGVQQAAVKVLGDNEHRRLIGYVVPAGGASLDPAVLATQAALTLPEYMVPSAVIVLDTLPLKSHGKVDREALPDPEFRRDGDFVAPRDAVEEAIAAIFTEILDTDEVSVHDDFFELGGHSLLATKVASRCRNLIIEGAKPISVMDVFTHPTVSGLAELVDRRNGMEDDARLLYELTPHVHDEKRAYSIICAPYGGANASIFSSLARSLPNNVSLYAIEVPGHDPLSPAEHLPVEEVARLVTEELAATVHGDLVIYGHCGPGAALAAALAQEVERSGRDLKAVFIGGSFPFARPPSKILATISDITGMDRIASDRNHATWLAGMGAGINELDSDTADYMVKAMRKDGRLAEEYFTERYRSGFFRCSAPVISVVGSDDPATAFYQERHREWSIISDRTQVVVIKGAGHYFVTHRADELAELMTAAVAANDANAETTLTLENRPTGATWWLADSAEAVGKATVRAPQPTMRSRLSGEVDAITPMNGMGRFSIITAAQFLGIMGSTTAGFAVPLWVLTNTGNMAIFGLLMVAGSLPGAILAPFAGTLVDRTNRRAMIIGCDVVSLTLQAILLLMVFVDRLSVPVLTVMFALLTTTVTVQRIALRSAIPQIVPKRYLGHANGLLQTAMGFAQVSAPLIGVGLVAFLGLQGVLVGVVGAYIIAIAVMLIVKFPSGMPENESGMLRDLADGFIFSMGNKNFRAMLVFFGAVNLLLAPLIALINPLALALGDLGSVGVVNTVAGVAGVVGGVIMTVWGGPRHRRMLAMRMMTVGLGISSVVCAVWPSTMALIIGAFGINVVISLVNGLVATMIQAKVPQRLQGRVFSINSTLAQLTAPLGFGLIAPFASKWLRSSMDRDDAVGSVMSSILGAGEGREFALIYLACGVILVAMVALTSGWRPLSRFDDEVPDAMADDLLGMENEPAMLALATPWRRGTPADEVTPDDAAQVPEMAVP